MKRIKIRGGLVVDFEEDGIDIIENLGYPRLERSICINHKKFEMLIKEYKKWKKKEADREG
jgi:hypothetical protein